MNVDYTSPSLLHLRTVSAESAEVVVAVAGELDAGNISWLRIWITDTVDRHRPAALVLDLSELHFIDVSGVRALYELHTIAAAHDCTMSVGPLHDAVRLTLSRLGLDPEFTRPATSRPVI
jgi:anti-anti-sigma factor